jgi:hypothetical protein
VVTVANGNEPAQLPTGDFSLYHSQNLHQWKISPETEKWSNFTGSEEVLCLHNFYEAG